MDVGVALPQMAKDYRPSTTVEWARGIDAGPFSCVAAGERITFANPELVVSLAAAAAVTERVSVFANVWVLPLHNVAMVAKQVASLDQLSNGRLVLGVGVGAREHDYLSVNARFAGRHSHLDRQMAQLRGLLSGTPPFDGADPIGPQLVQRDGPPILASALGPKSMRRAAAWADGITGFTVSARREHFEKPNRLAEEVWAEAGRPAPRKVNGCFYAVGVPDALTVLREFTARYLGWLGEDVARAMVAQTWVANASDLTRVLDDAEAAGCDEFVAVPATADLRCLDETARVVAER